jgi:hypothetical protein
MQRPRIERFLFSSMLLTLDPTPPKIPIWKWKKLLKGVMALFVTTKSSLRERIAEIVCDPNRYCFVSSPDVIHAAVSYSYILVECTKAMEGK